MKRVRSYSEALEAADSRRFQRFLTAWAQDCLRLSGKGLHRPIARQGEGVVAPAARQGLLERPAEDLSMIHWNPGVSAAARA